MHLQRICAPASGQPRPAWQLRRTRTDLQGWTHTGGSACRGHQTAPLADGSPDWSRPAHEPDNSPRAVAGRLLAMAAVYTWGAAVSMFGLWATHQPTVQHATEVWILAMPGPGLFWQTAESLITLAVLAVSGWLLARNWRLQLRRPRRLGLVSSPARLARGVVRSEAERVRTAHARFATGRAVPSTDAGSVNIGWLIWQLLPIGCLFAAVINWTGGSPNSHDLALPLALAAVLTAAVNVLLRPGGARHPAANTADSAMARVCESCHRLPGTVAVRFSDDVTFSVCADCLAAGVHAPSPAAHSAEVAR